MGWQQLEYSHTVAEEEQFTCEQPAHYTLRDWSKMTKL